VKTRITRTYETFSIKFESSEWTNYDSHEAAERGARFSTRPYEIVRRTFEVSFEKDSNLHRLALRHGAPFIAEREEVLS